MNPIPPPARFSHAISSDIGIGQGDLTGNVTGENAHHLTAREYEREGDTDNLEYQRMWDELSFIRNAHVGEVARVVDDIGGLRQGLRLRTDLRGFAIGELVEVLKRRFGDMFLRGLYLYAKVRDVHVTSREAGGGGVGYNSYIRDTRVKYVPLWRVLPVLPVAINPVTGAKYTFTGGSLEEHIAGMKRLFFERLINPHLESELSGSDVASFFILEEATIMRRNQSPAYMDTRISPIRTGGFGELLPTVSTFSFTVGELLNVYGANILKAFEGTPSAEGRKTTKTNDFSSLLTAMIFPFSYVVDEPGAAEGDEEDEEAAYLLAAIRELREHKFTIVLPGGTGCCVDNCIKEVLKLAASEYRGREFNEGIVERARAAAKEAYVTSRLAANKKKRKRGEGQDGERELQLASGKEFENRTKHGYSPIFFRLLKSALRTSFEINPRIFYERVEDLVANSSTRRRRLLEVGAGNATSKACDTNPHSWSQSSPLEDRFLNICMFRINLNGQIHQHLPKSEYKLKGSMSEATAVPFITDEEEGGSGLLHAIGLFPYVPFAILKDKHMFEAFVQLIEAKTVPLMMMRRGEAFGSQTITVEELTTLVQYQRKRHEEEQTNTLIYGGQREWQGGQQQPPLEFNSLSDSFNTARLVEAERQEFVDKPLVIAYDLETVELTSEAVLSGAVPSKFLRPNPDSDKYEQLERQIPYMVQWVPVNLSDEGDILEKKERLGLLPRRDIPTLSDFPSQNDWINGRGFEELELGAKRYRKGWIVLDEVKIEYGGNKLGQCIEDFIQNVFVWAVKHGYTSVKCYAHNGASFDTMVLQAFNTIFKISKILKVKGSILNLQLKIPLGSGGGRGKHFYISFGDTRKFLAGSLDTLCKDFKLPLAWSKLDFPITRINWQTCFHPHIKNLVAPYGINDALSLAFIIKQINRMLCMHTKDIVILGKEELNDSSSEVSSSSSSSFTLSPAGEIFVNSLPHMNIINIRSMKAPIDQFCTIMSFVKRVLSCHVNLHPDRIHYKPTAVDVPALRHWVDMSLVGGRVSAYCKVYASSRLPSILSAWMQNDLERVKFLVKEAILRKDVEIVLDMTSLYPSAMRFCALPMGSIFPLTVNEAKDAIDSIGCGQCEDIMTLCPLHRCGSPSSINRPFATILVRDFFPSASAKASLINLVGRKIRPITLSHNGGRVNMNSENPEKKSDGLLYNLETASETTRRLWGEAPEGVGETDWNVYGDVQAYTNVDLYWAKKCGFTFEIVGGFGWDVSPMLSDLYGGLFDLRAKAKAEKNHSLQLGLKNLLNGGYGVHCQKTIHTIEKVVDLPEEIYDCDIRDGRVMQYLRNHHHSTFDSRFVLKENIPLATKQSFIRAKMPADLGEIVGGASPNHIGAAVLAWSRHLMNLVMFPLISMTGGAAVTYTDTDSMAISEEMYSFLQTKMPHLLDEKGATLATFKNDHSDIFKNGRVIFSALGGKKVKMHLVACPDSGNLKVCNTYKGFITDSTDSEGRKYSKERADFTVSKALIDILYYGKPEGHEGTRWSRDIVGGVRVEKSVEFKSTSKAYLGHCAGFAPLSAPWGEVEMQGLLVACIPHGSIHQFEPGTPIFLPIRENPDSNSELSLPASWRVFLDRNLGVTEDDLIWFFTKYFSQKDQMYGGGDPEWEATNTLIDRVQEGMSSFVPLPEAANDALSLSQLFDDDESDLEYKRWGGSYEQEIPFSMLSPFSPSLNADDGAEFDLGEEGESAWGEGEEEMGEDFDFDFF